MPLPKLPVHGLTDENHARRVRESINGVLDHSFDDSKITTVAEKVSGIPVINPAFLPGHVHRYGAIGDGTIDDTQAWNYAVAAMSASGGGIVTCLPGHTYKCTSAVALADNVSIDANWSRINFYLTGTDYGFRIVSNSGIKRARIYTVSSTTPSSQGIFHTPISIGAPLDNGDTTSSVNAFQTAFSWFIEDVELGNVRDYGPCIQGMGDVYGFVIRRVTIPDSTTCSGIHFDWGGVGAPDSSNISGTRTNFNNGACYTTHPHNGTIEDCTFGALTKAASGDLASHGVRISACYGITVQNCTIEDYTGSAYMHTGGDMGFEFALAIEKPHACKNNICRNFTTTAVQSSGSSRYGAFVDTLADNVYRAQFTGSYSPLLNPLMDAHVEIENNSFLGPNADSHYGVRITQARGVFVRKNTLQKWTNGIWVDEFTQDIEVSFNKVSANRQAGIIVGFALVREWTDEISIHDNQCYGNGTDVASPGIKLVRGRKIKVVGNKLGTASEATQTFGIRCEDNAAALSGIRIDNNDCLGATSGAYSLMSSTPADFYRTIVSFFNNTADFGITTIQSGQQYLPSNQRITGTSRQADWRLPTSSTSKPTDGTWYKGDTLYLSAPVSGGGPAYCCTTSGTFGTLTSITNGSTTNGSATFTCSLTGITVNTTQASYQVTVSSATGIRAGMKCSISAAGITDSVILSVSGTTLQLDTQANSNQTAVTFTTSGLIEGEVISINTTSAISSATILKITGTSVTIDVTASNTQASRTITYTTPDFKAQAAIA